MAAAAFSAAPMPPPISRYQAPPGVIPALCQRRFSFASVPLLSPRETNGACACAIARRAAPASCPPAMCAGSPAGPTRMKSFQAISRRLTPWRSAMNRSSASGSCTSTRSASPLAAVARAWPVPWATTWTSIPVSRVKIGRMWPRRPLFSTEVVEASTIVWCCCAGCADATGAAAVDSVLARKRRGSRDVFIGLPGCGCGIA